jgi:hypothetical protein
VSTPDQEPAAAPSPFEDIEPENPLIGWAKAIVGGIGDTAKDMLEEGRQGARKAMEEGWDRFDAKTRNRRRSRP